MISIETSCDGELQDITCVKTTEAEGAAFAEYLRDKSERIPAAPLLRIFLANYRRGLRYSLSVRNWITPTKEPAL